MKRNGAHKRTLKYVAEIDAKIAHQLIYTWLSILETDIREKNFDNPKTLFHSKATCFGLKGAHKDYDTTLENEFKRTWDDFNTFTFGVSEAILINEGRTWVVDLQWQSKGRILGNTRKGFATFVLRFFDNNLLCLHSHISE